MTIIDELYNWDWNKITNYYGSSHSSMIGFISYNWINKTNRTVFDSPPSISIEGIKHYSDLLLCENNEPIVCVEVETTPEKYEEKYNNIKSYMDTFDSIKYGILVMYNNKPNKNVNHNIFDTIYSIWNSDNEFNNKIIIIKIGKDDRILKCDVVNRINKGFYSFQKKLPEICIK